MQTYKRVSKTFALMTAALAMAAALAVGAFAAEQTRESYVAQVEPICKKNTVSLERVLKNVRKQVQHNELKPAAVAFGKAAKSFEQATKELRAVPQPAADTAKLNKWLKQLDTGTGLLRKIGKTLKAENKGLAQNYIVRLTNNSRLANNIVLGFEFHYCLVDSSRFS